MVSASSMGWKLEFGGEASIHIAFAVESHRAAVPCGLPANGRLLRAMGRAIGARGRDPWPARPGSRGNKRQQTRLNASKRQ